MKILYVGSVGFPVGFMAASQKQKLIARSLVGGGCDVTIVSRKAIGQNTDLPYKGIYEGINYYYTTFSINKPKNPFLKLFSKYLGSFIEFFYILFKPANIILTNNRSFSRIFIYKLLSKLKGSKLVLTFVEDNDFVPMSTSRIGLLENKLFNKYAWRLANGALPISKYLKDKIANKNSSLPQLIVPVLVDIETINKIYSQNVVQNNPFFLFCGSAFYYEVVHFIIDSYKEAQLKSDLYLVVNGSKNQLKKIENHIKNNELENKVRIFQKLPYNELITYYKTARALLIPLRDNIQDKARFPHKIGEYCASKNAIISSNWGEIPNYFHHRENALLMNIYSVKELSGLMKEIELNPDLRETLANKAYQLALNEFDYKIFSSKLISFFKSLKK